MTYKMLMGSEQNALAFKLNTFESGSKLDFVAFIYQSSGSLFCLSGTQLPAFSIITLMLQISTAF